MNRNTDVYEPFAALAHGMAGLEGCGDFFVYAKTKKRGLRGVVRPTSPEKSAGAGTGRIGQHVLVTGRGKPCGRPDQSPKRYGPAYAHIGITVMQLGLPATPSRVRLRRQGAVARSS